MSPRKSIPLRRQIIQAIALGGYGGSLLAAQAIAPTVTGAGRAAGDADYPAVVDGKALQFPRDFGAHPPFRTEWWYLTAWLETGNGPLGLQLTFFRSRTRFGRTNPSRFAPRQLVFAHVAVADPARGRLVHAEQAWRQDPVMGRTALGDTDVSIGPPHRRWQLQRLKQDIYTAKITDPAFLINLQVRPSGAPVPQGHRGFSRKGVRDEQASYYYSRPQLGISGQIQWPDNKRQDLTGTGWLDHEWSSELLDPQAQGWDWVGLNFSDGSALMAFEMRARNGPPLRRTARLIDAAGKNRDLPVRFTALRHWDSPRTGTRYPVAWRIEAGALDLELEPLMDDQELDSRRSTGTIYWEGAVRVFRRSDRKLLGQGYLEMTGYGTPMAL